MTKIIFATGNKDKMREIREIMADCDVEITSMKEAGINVDIVEDGTTFEENALIKARAIAAYTDAIVLADDSGLEIDALNKEPGVYSARYMGEDTSYTIKNQNLIERLDGVEKEKRTARFVCAQSSENRKRQSGTDQTRDDKRAYGVRKRQKKRILLRHPIWKIPGRDLRNTSGCQRKRRQH